MSNKDTQELTQQIRKELQALDDRREYIDDLVNKLCAVLEGLDVLGINIIFVSGLAVIVHNGNILPKGTTIN